MDWYVPVHSKLTREYLGNVAWNFTVKLNLHLPGEGWKVCIAYAMIPPMSLLKPLQSARENLIELHLVSKKAGQPDQPQKAVLKGSDLSIWETGGLCETGLDFFNTVKHHLEEKLQSALLKGYQYTKQTWQTLEWSKEGNEPEIVIKPGDKGNKLIVSRQMAEAFGWIHQHRWSNLVHNYPHHKKATSSFNTDSAIYMTPTTHWLSTLSEWRFIYLNQSFTKASNLTPRPLKVTAVIKQEGGERVKQDLGVIDYEPEGRTETMFIPKQEMFYHTSVSEWGEVTFTVKELFTRIDVPFVKNQHLYLILHFQQNNVM